MKEGLTMKAEWRIASEILPEDGEKVLVYGEHPVYGIKKSYRRGMTCGKYSDSTGKWECENLIGIRVIAWLPLPEAPEGV